MKKYKVARKYRLETLKSARKLISDPTKWTTRFLARNSSGLPVHPSSDAAVCFCAIGALVKVSKRIKTLNECADNLHETVVKNTKHQRIEILNDIEGHSSVLAIFDGTISNLESSLKSIK